MVMVGVQLVETSPHSDYDAGSNPENLSGWSFFCQCMHERSVNRCLSLCVKDLRPMLCVPRLPYGDGRTWALFDPCDPERKKCVNINRWKDDGWKLE